MNKNQILTDHYCACVIVATSNRFAVQGFLGAAAATLALIVASPFAGMDVPSLSLPTSSPAVSRPAKVVKVDAVATSSSTKINPKKIVKAKVKFDRSGYNLDTTVTADTAAMDKVAAEKAAAAEKIAADKAAAAEKDADSKAGTFHNSHV